MPEKAFSVCIKDSVFIDSPYNTGHDFVYKDDFAADADAYKKASGEYDENGGQLVANPETSGRFHSDCCSMIYPRLLLARDFLTPDGAIFISIDHVTSVFGDPTTYSPKMEDTTPQNGRQTSTIGDT